jgi:hypothetical protein
MIRWPDTGMSMKNRAKKQKYKTFTPAVSSQAFRQMCYLHEHSDIHHMAMVS